ncbi:nitrite reductase [Streptomyces sp. LZ34]
MRGRADACPGALRLHPADDGALARVRLPAGILTARQALVLALAAEELGDGRLDLTSRGNLQLRGLDAECGAGLAARLRTAGLLPSDRHDRVRNIVASPLSGLDGAGYADVPAWARELDALLCDDAPAGSGFAELAGLSGRFLFALDDGRGDVAALGADVTLIAAPDGEAVLRLGSGGERARPRAEAGPESGAPPAPDGPGVAGPRGTGDGPARRGGPAGGDDTPGATRPLSRPDPPAGPVGAPGAELRVGADDAPRAAAVAALAFLEAARTSDTRAWRVRDLPTRHAVTADALARRLAEAGIPAARPGPEPGPRPSDRPPAPVPPAEAAAATTETAETRRRPGTSGASGSAGPALGPDPRPGERHTDTTPPVPPRARSAPSPEPTAPATGLITGPDERCAVSVAVPLGRLTAARWRLLAELASRGGSGELRVTPWRGVVLPGFSHGGARASLRELADAGLVTTPHSPWLGVGACTGRPGCAKSLADVRADAARAVAGEAPAEGGPGPLPGRLPVYLSGCERRCGHPGGRWVDVLATGDGYQVTVRGAAGSARGVDVTAEQLAGAVAAARGTT